MFGIDTKDVGGVTNEDDEALDKAPWGELESEEEESEEVCVCHYVPSVSYNWCTFHVIVM